MSAEVTERRLAANEDVFREVNEGIERGQWPGDPEAPVAFRCECARLGCNVLLGLPIGEYRRIRASSRRFFLVPGHELPAIETVVERHDGHLVVEKTGQAGDEAQSLDARRP